MTAIEIDRKSLLELARGANLYQEPSACVRELLSNAVDATLLRLFVERGAAAYPTNDESMHALRRALTDHPIDVTTEAVGSRHDGAIRVRIRDRGTGIASGDVAYLGTLGASSRNPARRALIDGMPEWMRPTGAFGIGLHSAFLVSDELTLRTRSLDGAPRAYRLRASEDGATLEEIDTPPLEGIGTEVTVDIARGRGLGVTHFPDAAYYKDLSFDPLLEDAPDHELAAVRALLRALGAGTPAAVAIDGARTDPYFSPTHAVFDPQSLVELAWYDGAGPAGPTWTQRGMSAAYEHHPDDFYRGAPAHLGLARELHLRVRVNLHAGTARDYLMVSRDVASGEGVHEATKRAREALRRIGPRWLEAGSTVPRTYRPWISRALWLRDEPASTSDPSEAWRDALVIDEDGQHLTLGDIAALPFVEQRSEEEGFVGVAFPTIDLRVKWADPRQDLARLFGHARLEELVGHERHVLRWGAGLRGAALSAYRGVLRSLEPGRGIAPLPERYAGLAIDWDQLRRSLGDRVYGILPAVSASHTQLYGVLPYYTDEHEVRVPALERWVRLVAEHALGGARDPAKVAAEGLAFLVDFDADVRWKDRKVAYELAELRSTLEAAFGPMPTIEVVRATLAELPDEPMTH